jgi:16S rRNA (cytidine1402-2'-O)-methyltransferase
MVEIPQETGRSVAIERPCLYLVATPIGNLADITRRALQVLAGVDLILAEDTRTTLHLLDHYQVHRPLESLHQQNEQARAESLVRRLLQESLAMALVSDAGMPLISDPGFPLVAACIKAGIPVRVIPGPSAVLAALAASGLPATTFSFEGFLPPRQAARRARLQSLATATRTLVFFEAPHRILEALADVIAAMGEGRAVCVARELTKLHEVFYRGCAAEVLTRIQADPHAEKGEIVLLVGPAPEAAADEDLPRRLLTVLLGHLSRRDAVDAVAAATGFPRNRLYDLALSLKTESAD